MPSDIELLRRRILEVAFQAQEGHVPSALSILDVLWVLYAKSLSLGDKVILSKGHACLALYALLEWQGKLPPEILDGFCSPTTELRGHPERNRAYGIEATTGSLGHGLPMAAGMALAKRIKGEPGRVFCLVGDGELEEGSCWETAHIAAKLCLSNLVVIVDDNASSPNKLRGQRFRSDIETKFASFGWFVYSVDGHDHGALERVLRHESGLEPVVIVAKTIKGKGVSAMEREPHVWHHRAPAREMLETELVS